MNNNPYWKDKINDPNTLPSEEIETLKQLRKLPNLTKSYEDWNYNQQLANNTFSMKAAFDTVIETMERSYYHDMMENDMISGFYSHVGTTDKLIATNADPATFEGIGGGEFDRHPMNHLDARERRRDISLIDTDEDNGFIVTNPLTKRAQPDVMNDPYGKDIAVKLGTTWFKYVWTWDFIESMNREIFARTKLLNQWLDKDTFCKYHDIWQHSLLVYVNGLPVNDFSVMFTRASNMLKLPFDNNIFRKIQSNTSVDLRVYRIASKKHYWAQITWDKLMTSNGGIIDSTVWSDYYDIFDPGDTDLVILNMCEMKTTANMAYRDIQQTEMLQGPQTVFLHLHRRDNGTRYLDLNEIEPHVLSWWKACEYLNVDIIRPKNMHEYTANGEYPFLVTKDEFPEQADTSAKTYNNVYDVIDLKAALKKDNGPELGVSEEDILCFKQYSDNSPEGKDKINDGWRPTTFNVIRSYPNTFTLSRNLSNNDIVEIRPYEIFYDALSGIEGASYSTLDRFDLDGIKSQFKKHNLDQFNDMKSSNLDSTQISIGEQEYIIDPLPNAKVYYFTKTLYKDTELDPIVLRAMKTARKYLFNPYKYTPPHISNLKSGEEILIREDGNKDVPYIVLQKDYPVKGKTMCIRKYAISHQSTIGENVIDTVANDYFDFYDDEFSTTVTDEEYTNGDRSHMWGRFGVSSLRFLDKADVPYHDATTNCVQYKPARFFDASVQEVFGYNPFDTKPQYAGGHYNYSQHPEFFNNLTARLCYLDEKEEVEVKWRLRDQSRSMQTYLPPSGRPSYMYVDERGQIKDDMKPDDQVYMRPCILIDNEYDFDRWNKLLDGIKVEKPDYLQPFALTHWNDAELLRVILSNKRYFLKYFKTLFPDDNYYGVERFYKYSDQNMANMMDIVESVGSYDSMTDGIRGPAYGTGNVVKDREVDVDVKNKRKWIVTRATIAYLPEKVDQHYIDGGWESNYTINTHIMTSNGVHLVMNRAQYHTLTADQYRKTLTIVAKGSGYLVTDKIYVRSSTKQEFICNVIEVDTDGGVVKLDVMVWVDQLSWDYAAEVLGGHGSGLVLNLAQDILPQLEEGDYYPYVGMELHIEHPTVYDENPAGRFLECTTITGTGTGMLVTIETDNIKYDPARDREMWLYPFDYLTLKLRNFIKLYPDNFMDYLENQFKTPFADWSLRVFQDEDISSYKRYYSKNVFVYTTHIDLENGKNTTEFTMFPGYHARLKDIKVWREYDVFATGDDMTEIDGQPILIHTSGRRLIHHDDDTGSIFGVDDNGNTIWTVDALQEDGTWINVMDPEYDITRGVRLTHNLPYVYRSEDSDQPHWDTIYPEFENPPVWDIPDVMSCSVHWEFLSIRDSQYDAMWQNATQFERFDKPKFLVRFNNETLVDMYQTDYKEITYVPFVGGIEHDFCEKEHYEHDDYVYYPWDEIYNLKASFIEKPPEHHKSYRVKNYKIDLHFARGHMYHVGMEVRFECITPDHPAYKKVILLTVVDNVLSGSEQDTIFLHIHDHERVFFDYDPSGEWRAIIDASQRANDKFHIGSGEQNSDDPLERIEWWNNPVNREMINVPTITIVGELVSDEFIPGEKYFVETNNTFTIRKLFNYRWGEEFSLPASDPVWGSGKVLHPAENHFNELHLEDLKIINTDTNQVVQYDIADGQEVFTLIDIEPDVNQSIQFRNRYDMKYLQIREYNLNLKQPLYDVGDIEIKALRYNSDIRRMQTVDAVYIDPNATETIQAGIVIENIEVGNISNCMQDYYIPEAIFRSQWGISSGVIFDHRDYTFTNVALKDLGGNVVMYVDIDVRHTTLPFNFSGTLETINSWTRGNVENIRNESNNKPYPPQGPFYAVGNPVAGSPPMNPALGPYYPTNDYGVGPFKSGWTANTKYWPTTTEYDQLYSTNGGISPNNVSGIIWKPDRYSFPFEPGRQTITNVAMGTSSHEVKNSYIRIKHIYNFKAGNGISTTVRSKIWPSPSSKYNSDVPQAYTMGSDNHAINRSVMSTYRRASNNSSYIDPPIFLGLTRKMATYTGIVFQYSEGIKWEYDKETHKYIATNTAITGYRRRLFYMGMNSYPVTLSSEDGSSTASGTIQVYIGKREKGPPDSSWVYQESYQHVRPVRVNQNYQNASADYRKNPIFPYQTDFGRGQYVQFYTMETFYDPIMAVSNTATNKWSSNFGNPNFSYPDEETPLYHPTTPLDENVHSDDWWLPTKDLSYQNKIHENSMRSGYMDADYTNYQSQYGLWYKITTLTVQGDECVDATPHYVESWLEPKNIIRYWDYEQSKTINTTKKFTVEADTELDRLRNELHCDHVNHATISVTLWQSQNQPSDPTGYVRHHDVETDLYYWIKWSVDKADRQYVPWTKYSDKTFKVTLMYENDSWWKHSRIPFKIPYSFHGKIERDTGIDEEYHELHRGYYWIQIVPRLYHQGSISVAGTEAEIRNTSQGLQKGATAIVIEPGSPINNYMGTYDNGNWTFKKFVLDENISYSVFFMQGTTRSGYIAYLDGQWMEYNDQPPVEFSEDGDRFEFYTQTRLYKIYTAYERGVIGVYSLYDVPIINTYDFSYLYTSEYYPYLIDGIHSEQIYSALPYFYKGYQKFYAQIVNTFKEEIMWIPVWTYIGDGEPPFDEDDPERVWHSIDQKYIDINGKECDVQVAYHQEDFPVDIAEMIKLNHHTYFSQSKDIFYTCKRTSRKIKNTPFSVYVLPRQSVQELDCGFKYTDIQYQVRIDGPDGNYKAVIDMNPQQAIDDRGISKNSVAKFDGLVTSEDRITVRAVKGDRTYNVPLLNFPSFTKPLKTISQDGDGSIIEFQRHKPDDVRMIYTHTTYPRNPVWNARMIAPGGLLDLNYPFMKKLWFRSQFDPKRYEIWVNGRLLTHGDQYHIITPTKIILHGLTSLHNVEIVEINREPHKEFFRPTGDMRNRLDAIVSGCAIDSTYQHEFNFDEQTSFINAECWPQVKSDNPLFRYYPYNFDMEEDVLKIDSSTSDEYLEDDYQYASDMPFIEGAPVVTNVQFDDYQEFPAAGMDMDFIPNEAITRFFQEMWDKKIHDGRYDPSDRHLSDQFNIMWNSVAQSGQKWRIPTVPPESFTTGYLQDSRYKEYFPQYDKVFGKVKDRLYHDPSQPQYPMLLERDWVRYMYYTPNVTLQDEIRIMWDKVAQSKQPWQLNTYDPQIIHGARWNWKGWHKPTSIEDLAYYMLHKLNTKANPDKPWENQKNRSYYEPDKVYEEKNPDHYWGYLGNWIKDHYGLIDNPDLGYFQGWPGWYPWLNPHAPYRGPSKYWDTGRYNQGLPGGMTQSPYSVQTNININRQSPEIYKYKYLGDDTYRIWIDGVNEGDYSNDHLHTSSGTENLDGLTSVRILVYNRSTNELVHDLKDPISVHQSGSHDITGLTAGNVWEICVDFANRAGIRHGRVFKIDRKEPELLP